MRRIVTVVCCVLLVAAVASAQNATVKANAPIYIAPNPTATQVPLRIASVGTVLKVIAEEGGWVQVQFNDPQWGLRTGWVKADLIAIVRPMLDAQAPADTTRQPLPPPPPVTAPPQQLVSASPDTTKPRSAVKLKDVKIRGYVTSVTSSREFEIEDYRITRDQAFVLEFENESPELKFAPEDVRVGVEVEIKGGLDEETGELHAKSMKVDLDQFKRVKQTAIISYPPRRVSQNDGGWSGRFVADGQRIEVTPQTKVLFKPTSAEQKATKKKPAPKNDDTEEDDASLTPLRSLDQVTAGMVMSYEGPRSRDGVVTAERVTFMRNDLEGGEAKLWKSLEPQVKAFNGSKPGELKINHVGKFKLIPDEEVQTYVARLGQSLVPAHQRDLPDGDPRKLRFRFFVINDKTANAFALANGTVVVNAGLFAILENEAQLASIVGHELAHATQEHTWRQMQYHKKKRIGLGIAAIVAQAYGQYAVSDMLNLTLAAIQSGYSRSLENQADRIGLEYMVSAGYDPREAPRVWKNMARANGVHSTDFFWSSHDNEPTRRSYLMNELKNNFGDLDYSTVHSDPERFVAMRDRVLAASDGKIRLKVK